MIGEIDNRVSIRIADKVLAQWGYKGESKDPNRVFVTCKICGNLGQRLESEGTTPRVYLCSAVCRKENRRRQKIMRIEV